MGGGEEREKLKPPHHAYPSLFGSLGVTANPAFPRRGASVCSYSCTVRLEAFRGPNPRVSAAPCTCLAPTLPHRSPARSSTTRTRLKSESHPPSTLIPHSRRHRHRQRRHCRRIRIVSVRIDYSTLFDIAPDINPKLTCTKTDYLLVERHR